MAIIPRSFLPAGFPPIANFAVAPRGVSLHSPQFADYTKSKDADKAVLDGAKIMAMTVIDLWANAELQRSVKDAFGDGTVPEGVL